MSLLGTLGMVGCPILEDEIAHVLATDVEMERISFIDNEDSVNLVRKLRGLRPDLEIVLISEDSVETLPPYDGLSALVWMKSIGLHEYPDLLRDEVLSTLHRLDRVCDALLLFYGLCGNAFKKIDLLAEDLDSPVVILRDTKGQIVDDCIAVPLGGTEGYLSLLKRYPGVFYMTPAWAENWKKLISKMDMFRGLDKGEWDDLKFVFEMANYTQLLKIRTGLGDEAILHERSREFAEIFGFEELTLEPGWCSIQVAEESYARAKSLLEENGGRFR